MATDNYEPQARPDDIKPDTGEGHDSGLDQSPSEPRQRTGEKPEDWNPPAGNPGSDQDAQTKRGKGGA